MINGMINNLALYSGGAFQGRLLYIGFDWDSFDIPFE